MGTNQDYKNRALASLEGKWSNGAIAALIVLILTGGVGQIVTLPMNETTGLSFNSLWSVLCLPLSWGLAVYFLNLIRNENIDYGRLFDGYRDFLRILLAQFCVGFCILIGFIIFFVPGIIIGLMFSQTTFILKDDQQISFLDAMKKSKNMMKGHKSKLFWLTLSFIGWFILSCLTLGLGFLLLIPYWFSTAAHFYEDIKAEYGE